MPYPILKRTLLYPFSRRFDGRVTGWENLPQTRGYIVASNHIGYLDAMVLFACFVRKVNKKIYFLTKEDVTKMLGGRLSNYFSMIPVSMKQEDKHKSLDPAIAQLKNGAVIGIYPEGKRNTGANLLKGKTGAVRLALAAKVPIVPVGMYGPPGWTAKESVKNYFIRGKEIKFVIGRPMDFSAYHDREITKELLHDLTRQLMCAIGQLSKKTYPF